MKSISLNDLVGRELTSVTFIHDYVQFGIGDRFILSVFNPMRLRSKEREIGSNSHMFKDSLGALIGHSVARIEYRPEQQVSFVFQNEVTLTVALGENDFTGPEAITLTDTDGGSILVVRAGE